MEFLLGINLLSAFVLTCTCLVLLWLYLREKDGRQDLYEQGWKDCLAWMENRAEQEDEDWSSEEAEAHYSEEMHRYLYQEPSGEWGFFDETWNKSGLLFPTPKEAYEACKEYAKGLDRSPDDVQCFHCREWKDYRLFTLQKHEMISPEDAVCEDCYRSGCGDDPGQTPYFKKFEAHTKCPLCKTGFAYRLF